ncbi:MAG: phosphate signaling complex protein PhoU [Anaerolineales bacterium]|nr:phosphate signaling complex protein PhoU [Anaerolineales bacterium]
MVNPRATYDREFSEIQADIVRMGGLVEQAITRSIECLDRRDQGLANQIIADDTAINDLRFQLEEECLRLIARQQPAAGDLRAVLAALSIVPEMERMADHASGIAKTVLRMGDEPLLKPLINIPRMALTVREMLRASLKAFVQKDAEAAKAIALRDTEVDLLYRAMFDELIEIMAREPKTAPRATYLLWCGHNLERIGDRVTNIAERIVFMTTGNMKELNL